MGFPPVLTWLGLLLVGWAACVVGGGAHGIAGQVALALGMGVLLLLGPGLPRLPRGVSFALVAVILWLLLQWVPGWGGGRQWRIEAQSLGIAVGDSLVPQPLRWAEAAFALVLAVVWGALCLRYRPNRGVRLHGLQLLSGLGALMALPILLGNLFGWLWPLATEIQVFSFVPNRNQMGVILAMMTVSGVVLAFEQINRKPVKALMWLALAALPATAATTLHSRAAVALTFLGTILWLVLSFDRIEWRQRGGLVLACMVFAGAFSLPLGLVVWQRFGFDAELGLGPRGFLYREAWAMLMDAPLTGHGLGQFTDHFTRYRELSGFGTSALHPEQDWLWLGAEIGLGGVLLLVLLGVFFVRPTFRVGEHFDRYRLGYLLIAALPLLHSLVDVSAHRLAPMMLAIWAVAMAHPSEEDGATHPPSIPRAFSVGGGVVLFALGLWGVVLNVQGVPWHSVALREGLLAGQSEVTPIAQQRLPLAWRTHDAAMMAAAGNNDLRGAAAAGRRARWAAPHHAMLGVRQAELFWGSDRGLTLDGIRQAIAGDIDPVRIDRRKRLLQSALRDPGYREDVHHLLHGRVSDLAWFYRHAEEAELARWWPAVLAEDPRLRAWSPLDLAMVLRRLYDLDAVDLLSQTFAGNRALVDVYWPFLSLMQARNGEFSAATATRDAFIALPAPIRYGNHQNEAELRRQLRRNGQDFAALSGLLARHFDIEDWDRAAEDMALLHSWGRAPADFWAWRAMVEERVGEVDVAWQYWEAYFQRSGLMD